MTAHPIDLLYGMVPLFRLDSNVRNECDDERAVRGGLPYMIVRVTSSSVPLAVTAIIVLVDGDQTGDASARVLDCKLTARVLDRI